MTTVGVSGAWRGRLNQPKTLAATVLGGESGTPEDCQGIRRLDGQRSPPLGSLQGTDVGAPHWPRQVTWGKASRRWGDLDTDDGKVHAVDDRIGGKVGLWDGAALQWPGGWD